MSEMHRPSSTAIAQGSALLAALSVGNAAGEGSATGFSKAKATEHERDNVTSSFFRLFFFFLIE